MVPEIRFPGFKLNWKRDTLAKLVEMSSGGTPSRKKSSYWNGDIPWVTTAEVASQSIIKQTSEFITQQGLVNSSAKLFPINTILIALYGQGKTRGKAAMLGIEASTNQACLGILPNENINSYYIYHYLNQNYEKLRSMANSGSQENLSMAIVKDVMIPYPSLLEQQKITLFFTLFDQKIQKQLEKIELLNELKKGMMQKIFSREVRFRDGNGNVLPDWKVYKFEKIITNKSEKVNPEDGNDLNICIELDSIESGSGRIINDTELGDQRSAKNKFIKGEVLFGRLRPYLKKYWFADIDGMCSSEIWVLKPIIPELSSKYLYYFIQTERFMEYANKSSGSKMPRADWNIISRIDFYLPSKKEQEKINSFLTNLDSKIFNEKEKAELLEEQKKAFMQRMFV